MVLDSLLRKDPVLGADPGIVDQNIQFSKFVADGTGCCFTILSIGDIELYRERVDPFGFELRSSFFRGLGGSRGHYDGHALLPQLAGSFKTDSTIRARNQRDLLVSCHGDLSPV